MKKQRVISLVLVLCLGFVFCLPAFAEEHSHSYVNGICSDCGGYESVSLNSDTGFYEISSCGQLYSFAKDLNDGINLYSGKSVVLTSDIVFPEGLQWIPAGNNLNTFLGTFDGNNHTVTGLTITQSYFPAAGLFGQTGEGSIIRNLRLKNVNIQLNLDYIGGICGIANGTVSSCTVSGTISGSNHIGGIVGICNSSASIVNCSSSASVSGFYAIGGVCGYGNGSVDNSFEISGSSFSGSCLGANAVGGVCGYGNYADFSVCSNSGSVGDYNGQYGPGSYLGGICGYDSSCSVADCYNVGTITGFASGSAGIGGICGDSNGGPVTNCFNIGVVSGGSDTSGICGGKSSGSINYCYYYAPSETDKFDGTTFATAKDLASGKISWMLDTGNGTKSHSLIWSLGSPEGFSAETPASLPMFTDAEHPVVYRAQFILNLENYDATYAVAGGEIKVPSTDEYDIFSGWIPTPSLMPNNDIVFNGTAHKHAYDEDGFCPDDGACQPMNYISESLTYEIHNFGQLLSFKRMTLTDRVSFQNKTVKLCSDITIPDTYKWEPLSADTPFAGSFDGGFHIISGMRISAKDHVYSGFFAEVSGGSVSNLGIIGFSIDEIDDTTEAVGGVVARLENGAVTNCFTVGSIRRADITRCGGICGISTHASPTESVIGCYSYVYDVACLGTASTDLASGSCCLGNEGSAVSDFGAHKARGQFASGEVAGLLNTAFETKTNSGIWSQTSTLPVYANEASRPVYKVNYIQSDGGRIFGAAWAKEGSTVTLDAEIDSGYSCIFTADGAALPDNRFVMPDHDCTVTADFTLGGVQNPWSVSIDPTYVTIIAGQSYNLSFAVYPASAAQQVTFITGNTAVARVDSNGVVFGYGAGLARVTATDSLGHTAECFIRVMALNPRASILSESGSFTKKVDLISGYKGQQIFLKSSFSNCTPITYEWTSDNEMIAVDQYGTVTCLDDSACCAVITLTAYDKKGNEITSSSVTVGFFKLSWQEKILGLQPVDGTNPVAGSLLRFILRFLMLFF